MCYDKKQLLDRNLFKDGADGGLLECSICGKKVKDHPEPKPESTAAAKRGTDLDAKQNNRLITYIYIMQSFN